MFPVPLKQTSSPAQPDGEQVMRAGISPSPFSRALLRGKAGLLLALLFLCLTACQTTEIYLVRHAEKLDESTDPPLSEAGFERANTLRDSLLPVPLDLVFATKYQRTQQTVGPTAAAQSLPVEIYGTDTTFQFAQRLKKLKNKRVLVAGHSNTLPEMVAVFTADSIQIAHGDYDDLYTVLLRHGIFKTKGRLVRSTFGKRT